MKELVRKFHRRHDKDRDERMTVHVEGLLVGWDNKRFCFANTGLGDLRRATRLEAGASVFDLGPRSTVQAQLHGILLCLIRMYIRLGADGGHSNGPYQ
jgi:hypothetical protein